MYCDVVQLSLWRKVVSCRGRAAELVAGLLAKRMTEIGFDYLLYPYVIYHLGTLQGGVVMAILSGVACHAILRIYDWSGRDWLGIEAIKGLKNYQGRNLAARFTAWMLRTGDPMVFLFLSIKFDPFMTVAYLRHGAFNGMNRRDWSIFAASILVGNTYWTLVCLSGISLVEWCGKILAGG